MRVAGDRIADIDLGMRDAITDAQGDGVDDYPSWFDQAAVSRLCQGQAICRHLQRSGGVGLSVVTSRRCIRGMTGCAKGQVLVTWSVRLLRAEGQCSDPQGEQEKAQNRAKQERTNTAQRNERSHICLHICVTLFPVRCHMSPSCIQILKERQNP